MTLKKALPNKDALNKIVTEARRNQELREQSYRGQALKLYPWLCGLKWTPLSRQIMP